MRKIIIYSKKYGKKTVLVDREDYPRLIKITWTLQFHKENRRFIVCGWVNGRTEKLHRYILNIPYRSKLRIIHLDDDNFNNQKNNLKAIQKCEFAQLNDRIEMTLRSHAYGEHKFYFDKSFYEQFSQLTWRVTKSKYTFYAAIHGKNHKVIFMHQLVLKTRRSEVDHIDRDGHNNLSSNLRRANKTQNRCNTKMFKNNSTGFRGVIWIEKMKMYTAVLIAYKKVYRGGYFISKIEAAKKYNELAGKHHGEFATLNQIPNE